jgi:hypothetical protein
VHCPCPPGRGGCVVALVVALRRSLICVAGWSKPELLFIRSYLKFSFTTLGHDTSEISKQSLKYIRRRFTNERKQEIEVETARLVKMSGPIVAVKINKATAVHLSSASVETEAACHTALSIVGIRHLEEIGIGTIDMS